jgi:hypothetical protein
LALVIERNAYILDRKPEAKKRIGRPTHRWEGSIKMEIKEIWYEVVDWVHLALDRDLCLAVVNTVMILLVP